MVKKSAFLFTNGKNYYILETNQQRCTKKIINAIIEAIGNKTNCCSDLIERCKNDKSTVDKIRKNTSKIEVIYLEDKIVLFSDTFYCPLDKNSEIPIFINL